MRIIITGSSGFVGQNLAEYLKQHQIEIHGVSLRNDSWKSEIYSKANAIIHLAGKAHDTSRTSGKEEYFRANRDLTVALFKEFLKSDVKDFFFFSSVKAVSDSITSVLTESTKPNPFTPYGQSKFEAEQYLLNQQLPENKRLFIIRPSMIHGPGNKGNLNLLYKIAEKRVPWPLAAFSNERSFLSVDNLNFLIYQMLQKESLLSGIYNFADDQSISINDLIKIVSLELKNPPRLWNIPPNVMKGIAKIGDVFPFPLNSERLKKLTESYIVSNHKIKQALGINRLPLTAKEGLVKTIRSFKNK